MIKLSDIIKSGGGNAKINRFINRYVLSKKEKKDIVEAVKESEKGSSSNNSENIDIKCFEYIRIAGADLIYDLNQDFINMIVQQKVPLPNVLCAYSGSESSKGSWKALVDMPIDKAIVKYGHNSSDFEYGQAYDNGDTKCFGYIFNNMATSTSDGVMNSPFPNTNEFESIIDKDIVGTLGMGLCMLILFMIIAEDPNAEGNMNEVLREIINTMEFKEISLTEYYTVQYQKAKEYYNSLEPVK